VGVLVLVCWFAAGLTINDANANESLGNTAWLSAGIWGLLSLAILGIYTLFEVASIVPSLAIQSRRLHDANFSAWWLLLYLVPFGALALFIMNCFNSTNGESLYENEGRPRGRTNSPNRSPVSSGNSSDDW
jgi:uncharacterized membrane protein YhaH (DUF805 family)